MATARDKVAEARAARESHHRPPRKGNPLLLWGSMAAVLALGVFAFLMISKSAGEPEKRVAKAPTSTEESPPSPTPEALAAGVAAGSPAAAIPAPTPPPASAPATQPAKPPRERKPRIVEDLDLASIPDLLDEPGTSEEFSAEIRRAVAALVDPNSGARGTRAQMKLAEIGKPAFPAILNALKAIDYSTDEGKQLGNLINYNLLQKMTNGMNFGYRNSLDPEAVKWNKHVAKSWIQKYLEFRDDPKGWAKFIKAEGAEEAGAEKGKPKKAEDELGLDAVGPG